MEIGIFSQPETVDKAVEHARLFADAGFGSYWMPQIFGLDTLTAGLDRVVNFSCDSETS